MENGGQSPAPYLPDDLLVEILSRLPAKSLCRFKVVSRSWNTLIADPTRRRRFAQTLSGIFFSRHWDGYRMSWGFAALSTPPPHTWGDDDGGDDDSPAVEKENSPPLSFFPPTCGNIELLDSCNGLLLLRCSQARGAARSPQPPPPPPAFYVVCNPATAEWVALPQPSVEPGYEGSTEKYDMINTCYAALGYDPSVSSHYHVFQILQEEHQYFYFIKAVEIYSSETGAWVLRESGWKWRTAIEVEGGHTNTVHFNGFQHFTLYDESVGMVHASGKAWRQIQFPSDSSHYGFIGHSQGCLLFVSILEDQDDDDDAWAVYALEDHSREEWTFKHRISMNTLFGPFGYSGPNRCVATFHPDCDWIFFYDPERDKLMSYDMSKGDVHVICTLREVNVQHDESYPFLPYVSMYSRTLPSLPDAN